MTSKLLAIDNETVLLVPAWEIGGIPNLIGATAVPFSAPTADVLNRYIPIVSNSVTNWGAGGNITCAVEDGMSLGPTDPETDDSRTLCSVGASSEIKRYNFEAELTIFRDESLTDNTSAFNMARDLLRSPDVPYIIAHRVGYNYLSAAAVGQEWDIYYVHTDNPVPVYEDDGWQKITMTFVPKGVLNIGYEVAA